MSSIDFADFAFAITLVTFATAAFFVFFLISVVREGEAFALGRPGGPRGLRERPRFRSKPFSILSVFWDERLEFANEMNRTQCCMRCSLSFRAVHNAA